MWAVEIKDLHKQYQGGTHALQGVSLKIKKGDFFGLLGLNGAGKTTLISTLVGLVKPTSGDILIDGISLQKMPQKSKRLVGVMPQELNMNFFCTVKEVMFHHGGYYGLTRSEISQKYRSVLEDVGLLHKEKTAVKSLSGGMKRRLMLARAILVQPQVLILDEPTAGVDVDLRQEVWHLLQRLNKQGTTIILTTHYMEEAEFLCKRLAILHQGKIIDQGEKAQLCLSDQSRNFILHLQTDLSQAVSHASIDTDLIDARTLSVTLHQGADFSRYLQALDQMGCQVAYVSSPTSRLEQYFRSQTGDDK